MRQPGLPPEARTARLLALRAVMDGRGLDAAILSSARSLAWCEGEVAMDCRPLLVVTAGRAQLVRVGVPGGEWPAALPVSWISAARLLPRGCALGYEADALDEGALDMIEKLAAPRRMLSISRDIARQIAVLR